MPQRELLLCSSSRADGSAYLEPVLAAVRAGLGAAPRRALFLPYASVTVAHDAYAARVREGFARLGWELESAHEASDPRAAIARATAIVVGGGNTFHLLRELYRLELLGVLRERVLAGVPYVGWSAGANVACPTIRTTNDMPIVFPPSFDALALVPFQINPHYTDFVLPGHHGETRDERIAEFLEINRTVTVVGLREGSTLCVHGDRIELLGEKPLKLFRHGEVPREMAPGEDMGLLLA